MKTKTLAIAILFGALILLAGRLLAVDINSILENEFKNSNPDTCFLMDEPEPDIEVEYWMLSPATISVRHEVQEEEIQIEAWMLQPFKVNTLVHETDMKIEDWMLQPFKVDSL